MKVWYITSQFPVPSEVFASNDVRALGRHGVRVEVHGLRRAHPQRARLLRERGLEGVETSHNSVLASLEGLLRALGHPRLAGWSVREVLRRTRGRDRLVGLALLPRAWQLLARARRRRPDVLHVYWGHYPALVGHLAQRWLPHTAVTISFILYDLRRRYPLAAAVAARADMVRSVSSYNLADIEAFTGVPPERVEVIYDGLDLAHIDRVAAGRAVVPRRVVTAGRLVPNKGMDAVLESFARAARRWADASLVVLGDGPERERLERLAGELGVAERVAFRGHVRHDEVIAEMAEAEVFMLLSKHERLANVIKEAMACRALPIVTRTEGVEELLEDGVHGHLVDWRDVEGPAALLDEAFSGTARHAAMLEAGRERVEARFTLEGNVARYVELWRDATGRRRRGARSRAAARRPVPGD